MTLSAEFPDRISQRGKYALSCQAQRVPIEPGCVCVCFFLGGGNAALSASNDHRRVMGW